jgi:hypothetical protein
MTIPFCQFTIAEIRESGLLTPERMNAVEAEIERRILPCLDNLERVVPNVRVVDFGEAGLDVFTQLENPYNNEMMRRALLAVVLSKDELALLDKQFTDAHEAATNAGRFSKAEKVRTWDGAVFMGDQFFSSMAELLDHLSHSTDEWPEFVWASTVKNVIPTLSVDDVVESSLAENGTEGMDVGDLDGVDELKAALDRFTEANSGLHTYWADYTKAVILSPRPAALAESQARQGLPPPPTKLTLR